LIFAHGKVFEWFFRGLSPRKNGILLQNFRANLAQYAVKIDHLKTDDFFVCEMEDRESVLAGLLIRKLGLVPVNHHRVALRNHGADREGFRLKEGVASYKVTDLRREYFVNQVASAIQQDFFKVTADNEFVMV
jgi:hypothetical protein